MAQYPPDGVGDRLDEVANAALARVSQMESIVRAVLSEAEARAGQLADAESHFARVLQEKEAVIQDMAEAIRQLTTALQEKEGVIAELAAAAEERLRLVEALTVEVRALSTHERSSVAEERDRLV